MSISQCSDYKFTSVLLFSDTSFDNNKDPYTFDEPLFSFTLLHLMIYWNPWLIAVMWPD